MVPHVGKQEVISEFAFKYITHSEYAIVLAHLQGNFYSDEPVNKLIGSSQDRVTDQHKRYTDMLNRYPKSLCATTVIDEPGSVNVPVINRIKRYIIDCDCNSLILFCCKRSQEC